MFLVLGRDLEVLVIGCGPLAGVLWLVEAGLHEMAYHGAHLPHILDESAGLGLHHDVARCRCLLRTRVYVDTQSVGCELIE